MTNGQRMTKSQWRSKCHTFSSLLPFPAWPGQAYALAMPRILIVDDNEDPRMMLGNFLSLAGHETIFAANGWEALLTLEHANVDLILLDLMMPGMDGQTFLRILRQGQKKANLPVAIVTALDYG